MSLYIMSRCTVRLFAASSRWWEKWDSEGMQGGKEHELTIGRVVRPFIKLARWRYLTMNFSLPTPSCKLVHNQNKDSRTSPLFLFSLLVLWGLPGADDTFTISEGLTTLPPPESTMILHHLGYLLFKRPKDHDMNTS